MKPEEIVKRLHNIVYDNEFDAEVGFAAADLIERQAKEIDDLRVKLAETIMQQDGEFQALKQQAKALEEAEKTLLSAQDKFEPNYEVVTSAIAAIRAARG